MKVLIIGSMAFVKDMVDVRKQLKKMGHTANIPYGIKPHLKDKKFVDNLEANIKFCIKNNVMKRNFDLVVKNDAVLVLNKKRNAIDGYIGVSALMEMAIAHHNNKKVFLMHEIPHFSHYRWAHEVAIMQPIVLNGDLSKIE
ncbi:MAG: hypothetical protein Q7S38_00565 [bacterium]|nr:hypothetical protein [bacterium]